MIIALITYIVSVIIAFFLWSLITSKEDIYYTGSGLKDLIRYGLKMKDVSSLLIPGLAIILLILYCGIKLWEALKLN